MGYHKESLKEQLVEIAWEICTVESWQKVNLRRVAQKAGVSNTAFYRHFKSKNDLKAELMRRGFHLINRSIKDLTILKVTLQVLRCSFHKVWSGITRIFTI